MRTARFAAMLVPLSAIVFAAACDDKPAAKVQPSASTPGAGPRPSGAPSGTSGSTASASAVVAMVSPSPGGALTARIIALPGASGAVAMDYLATDRTARVLVPAGN